VTASIHPTAIVSAEAELAPGVDVGPYAVVGPRVRLGKDCRVGAHAQIEGPTTSEKGTGSFHSHRSASTLRTSSTRGRRAGSPSATATCFASSARSIGEPREDGARRRSATEISSWRTRTWRTTAASDPIPCWPTTSARRPHRRRGLGHARAYVGCHQFIRIGDHAYVGAFTVIRQDVLPFCKTDGHEAKTYGLNTIGLKRRGYSEERLQALEKAYRLLIRSKLNTSQALEAIARELPNQPDVDFLVSFVSSSERGFHR
jgi:UDP-N-acetylglucosamine acyltransferase